MKKLCEYCGAEFEAKRKTARFDKDECRVYFNRDEQRDFEAKPAEEKMTELEKRLGFKIDRTKAFTDEQQAKINKLPRHLRYEAMKRPNSAEVMTEQERTKHYKSSNYPENKLELSGEASRRWGA